MDLCLPRDFFHPANRRPLLRDDQETSLGADAHVHLDPAFVTGLRDWRSHPERGASLAADGEWQPI
ncbi:hypothetical protein [Chiayiivirga flava]|uniref:Uncharacterized protein n=1 Tax=Chiayiivirga flava TaxID=659595 RepID=A0A7W8D538_9GAMM|nr:hypothetical protein [Chiayiivirga flava]MBB5208093.1 hypothetical protein [Chiayiivirga flava]